MIEAPAKDCASAPLVGGERLDQKTFHARYENMPKHVKAELIGGIVYMSSPLRVDYGDPHGEVVTWLKIFKAATPGTRSLDNATTILSDYSEPQPDACLLILPEHGGQTSLNEKGYILGSPELGAEISLSTEDYDLHVKLPEYEKAGMKEYIVFLPRQEQVLWFVQRGEGFEPLTPGADGILRSEFFGGLWLDPAAILRCDTNRVLEVLRQGLVSPEHAQFLKRLKRS